MRHAIFATLTVLTIALTTTTVCGKKPNHYPATKYTDHKDVYHGQEVVDPFRWLEVDVRESEAVANWVTRQNEVSFGYLKQIPYRDAIEERVTQLWNYEKIGAPFKQGGRYFFSKNDGLQNQNVLYTQNALDEEPRVLIDPNTWSEDGTIALSGFSVSDDGKYAAYGVADAGSDWNTWRIMDIESGNILADELKWIKFSGAFWAHDSSGFYYSRYDKPEENAAHQSLNLNQKVFFHIVGTAQSEDQLVYRRPDQPEWGFSTEESEDGKYLVITIWKGTDDKYQVVYKDLTVGGNFVPLITEFANDYSFLGNDDQVFYFKTDKDAPRSRVIAIDTANAEAANWREVIPQADETLSGVGIVGDRFLVSYLKDARSQIKQFKMDGTLERQIKLPGIGTASGFGGKREYTETFYSFTSFTTPPSSYRYDITTGESTKLRQAKVDFDPSEYEVKQIFYNSKDGTRVPMFLAHKKGLKLDGSNPTLLYAYGGFNISLTPGFSVSRLAWMELGGVFAMPNLRGGGEYGEDWHVAGKLHDKQNVFDDFIAAAEWLIENKYTSPGKLAIQGRSNGGLLVGACMAQRPDLYGACLPGVGVMDMLRFHKFTAGRFWVDEYGSSDDPAQFKTLFAYSPYHNLKAGTSYPATMITTADTDDRVVPGHSFKFAAELQRTHEGDTPVIIRIETRAGHGAGKPTSKIIEEVADEWAFLVDNLGFEPLLTSDH
jgi:prolyl oligopeptidase